MNENVCEVKMCVLETGNNQQQFREELEWAYYLGVPSVFCMELAETNDNYAAILNEFIERKYTTPVLGCYCSHSIVLDSCEYPRCL